MTSSLKIPLVIIAGPTASGKTRLSIELAKHFDGEIISADSMQVYAGMNIATAKPTQAEMQNIPHHLMDFLPPTESFSVADYASIAHKTINNVYNSGKLPFLVGGTGLYINSVINNINFQENTSSEEVREELNKILKENGVDYLLEMLSEFDPESAKRLSEQKNAKRVIRAIEIYKVSGKTMTEQIEQSKIIPSPYKPIKIGITCKDRQNLYNRINLRVDQMLTNGLIEEAKKYRINNLGKTAAKAIGYKELEPFFNGEKPLEQAVERLKMETRRYAKRQLTWFLRDEEINWLYADQKNFEQNLKEAKEYISSNLITLK